MTKFKVQSLPLKDVIADLAKGFHTTYKEECDLYIVKLPAYVGTGTIKGINFNNGLGLIIYDCEFNDDVQIEFVLNEVHPMKYLYCLDGSLMHQFGNSDSIHTIEKYRNIIVACANNAGHVLKFKKRTRTRINSLEINRSVFIKEMDCEIQKLESSMKDALIDISGKNSFIYSGDYSLRTAAVFEELDKFSYEDFLRKGFYHGKAWEILVYQTIQYNRDQLEIGKTKDDKNLDLVRRTVLLIDNDPTAYPTIDELAKELGISDKRLQTLFKKYQNTTLNKYMMRKRMELIVDYLKNSDHSIKVISELAGITSVSYLSKLFKNHYGMTPTEFRES